MTTCEAPNHPCFVLLEGIEHHNRFITGHIPGVDPTKSAKGERWYRVLGYAETIAEAQKKLYGRSYSPFDDPPEYHESFAK